MEEQNLAIIVFGSLVVAFAFISSYMAMRQQAAEELAAKARTDVDC